MGKQWREEKENSCYPKENYDGFAQCAQDSTNPKSFRRFVAPSPMGCGQQKPDDLQNRKSNQRRQYSQNDLGRRDLKKQIVFAPGAQSPAQLHAETIDGERKRSTQVFNIEVLALGFARIGYGFDPVL